MFDDTPRGMLEFLLLTGGLVLALSTAPTLIAVLAGAGYVMQTNSRRHRQKIWSSFDYLKRHKYIAEHQVSGGRKRIVLTTVGRTRAEQYRLQRIMKTAIARPSKWDRRWRLILFDIPAENRSIRNAFRHMIQQMGAVMIQKSVWAFPFDCSDRIALLRSYFNLPESVLRVGLAENIGDDRAVRSHFKV